MSATAKQGTFLHVQLVYALDATVLEKKLKRTCIMSAFVAECVKAKAGFRRMVR
jgi:hypothetical protein